MAEREWVKDHFGAEARVTGECSCGRNLTAAEYRYCGGSHGLYVCADCGVRWTVDLNGAMWPERQPVDK
jgi:hypothetical protein